VDEFVGGKQAKREYPHLESKKVERGLLKGNEAVKQGLQHEAEAAI
jgi:hypothetical protein